MPRSNANASPAPAEDAASSSATNNRPAHVIRHRNVKATIWRNPTAKGVMYNVTVVRAYQDEAEQWHDTQSFGFDDLLVVAKLMYDAHSFINAQRSKDYPMSKRANA